MKNRASNLKRYDQYMAMNLNKYKTFNIYENTPAEFYKVLNQEFNFDFDPCPENASFDGLSSPWMGNSFINPPYGKEVRKWLEKGLLEIQCGRCNRCVYLLPAYTDVKWFHEVVLPNSSEIRFIKGRLKFGVHNNSAPFASMLVIFTNLLQISP